MDPWLRSVPTLPGKGNEMTELEKWVKGKLSHISPLCSVLLLDLRGRFAQVPVCITHGKDTVPHADGNAMFMCSRCLWFSDKTAALVASTESGRQSWERNIFLHKLSLTTNLTFKFRFWKIHFIHYVFNLKE